MRGIFPVILFGLRSSKSLTMFRGTAETFSADPVERELHCPNKIAERFPGDRCEHSSDLEHRGRLFIERREAVRNSVEIDSGRHGLRIYASEVIAYD